MVAVLAILMIGLTVSGASAAQPTARDEMLTETIPRAMQQASVPGAIVGVWQDGAAPFVQAFGVRDMHLLTGHRTHVGSKFSPPPPEPVNRRTSTLQSPNPRKPVAPL